MSTPPPNNPWGQPTPPDPQGSATPPAGEWNQPSSTAPSPQVPVGPAPSGSGNGNGKKIGIVVGALAAVAVLIFGGLALFGGDDGGRSTSGDDPEEAIAVAEDAVSAVLEGDCDKAEEFATRNFREQLDDLCGDAYPDSKITDASLENDEDPVVVLVEFEVQDAELSYPLAMEYDDDEEMWFVDSLDVTGGIPGTDDPTDTTDPTDDPTDTTDPTDDPTNEGDPEDAVEAATNLVQGLIDLDCDAAAEYATDDFATDELDGACDENPGTIEITDARVVKEDPVVVEVDFEGDEEGTFPFEMVYEDGEWLVDSFYVDAPTTDGPTESPTSGTDTPPSGPSVTATSSDGSPEDSVEIARAAIEALADGDCDTALSYGTEFFQDFYGEDICSALPAGTSVTGAELTSESPVIVSVDTDADFGIELYMVYADGAWLVDDYSV